MSVGGWSRRPGWRSGNEKARKTSIRNYQHVETHLKPGEWISLTREHESRKGKMRNLEITNI